MLKIFKNHAGKASLLDDFMYYENRQKIMQEEKTKLLIKSYGSTEDIVSEFKDIDASSLKIGSLAINPEQSECITLVDVVTVGSMPVRVDGYAKSSGLLTVGTISVDPKSLHPDEAGVTKNGSHH
ncbi:evolutionarily conserved C-terminal region 3 [Actinidia rufa]|uniref:Evolutionarily conserved C-terminal region 3 n=1 Tax=Actinidia rufa TaxID=165716 RepID=A0A7J0GLH8_9ERIC|nr:evolutionarily conserved C-terminal region 3 [Actinidia rufa]